MNSALLIARVLAQWLLFDDASRQVLFFATGPRCVVQDPAALPGQQLWSNHKSIYHYNYKLVGNYFIPGIMCNHAKFSVAYEKMMYHIFGFSYAQFHVRQLFIQLRRKFEIIPLGFVNLRNVPDPK